MSNSTINNISKLSQVSTKTLNKFVELAELSIIDSFVESEMQNIDITEVDIGIGELTIIHKDAEMRFRFKPSAKLQEQFKQVLEGNREVFEQKLETSLVNKINKLYKDLV